MVIYTGIYLLCSCEQARFLCLHYLRSNILRTLLYLLLTPTRRRAFDFLFICQLRKSYVKLKPKRTLYIYLLVLAVLSQDVNIRRGAKVSQEYARTTLLSSVIFNALIKKYMIAFLYRILCYIFHALPV